MDQVLDSNAQTNAKDTRWKNRTRKKERKKSFAEKWKLIAGIFFLKKHLLRDNNFRHYIWSKLLQNTYLITFIQVWLLLLSNRKNVPCFYRGIETWVEAWENEKCWVLQNFHECSYLKIRVWARDFYEVITNTSYKSRANNLTVLVESLLKFTSNAGSQLLSDVLLNFAP